MPGGGGDGVARVGVLVVGGGVCGLWTLHALLAAGRDAWLIEKSALGDGQTVASQGILHRGTKYDLTDGARASSREAGEAAGVWEDAMRGEGGPGVPDLRGVRVLSESTVFWTVPSLGARAVAMVAAKKMKSSAERVDRASWPAGFSGAPRGIEVYRAGEPVLDPVSVVGRLAAGLDGRVKRGRVVSIGGGAGDDAGAAGVDVVIEDGDGRAVRVRAGAVVLAAGEGNEGLIGIAGGETGGESGAMQRRPLHQLVARGAPFDLFGHCLGASSEPLLTVTTGELDGERTWYLGGGPAEDGVGRDGAAQAEAGRRVIVRCLPWVDAGALRWETFRIDRAEGANGGKRPAGPVATWVGDRVLAVWPTKLVLAPSAAAMVMERLAERVGERVGDGAADAVDDGGGLASLPEPGVAGRVW